MSQCHHTDELRSLLKVRDGVKPSTLPTPFPPTSMSSDKAPQAKKFRKKPVVIEAFQWTIDVVPDWWREVQDVRVDVRTGSAIIPTLEGEMRAQIGDWIILGIAGEVYPCKPDIFEATYEPCNLKAEQKPVAKEPICFCRSGKMKQCDICTCKCCDHEETMMGNWNPTKKTRKECICKCHKKPDASEGMEELTEKEMDRMCMALLDVHLACDEPQQVFIDLKHCLSYIRSLQQRVKDMEQEKQKMVKVLNLIEGGSGCSLHRCGLWASECLSSLSPSSNAT